VSNFRFLLAFPFTPPSNRHGPPRRWCAGTIDGRSTKPIASTVTNAGICRTRRFAFDLPAATDAGMRIAP
jgi:hypothetical protein